ncbi:nitrous oxide reductase accessory protein NosL [Bordetella petrii]|uniref:Protein disulfide isomerase NosL, putative n=1 Tax=Bordetella petrii (strain ATCC BAA-461 / DSM 12804 / CCUG 43448 / CIP 107267 / Se-1111R) TaxID=340100 RepID=A9ICQ0_BORPD|nr:nitrous oxide reductase accessory protein NosL [Bordetella petrii]CAP44694.1 protein disulfide isomerase NosL, putative [Bordetella petrii]
MSPLRLYHRAARLAAAMLLVGLAACGGDERQAAAPPSPQAITTEAVGHYCGMALDEHTGPKGQIFLEGQDTPVWFSAIKQVFAYTVLPEEPKSIRAIYVNDMAGAERGQGPDPAAWIDARQAYYVIESRYIGGMGAEDAMPFGQRAQAEAFAQTHGGRVAAFQEVPESYIFSQGAPAAAPTN